MHFLLNMDSDSPSIRIWIR